MFSFALFMKPESQGRDCVHLSVICSTLPMPPCHMSFYLAAHQQAKSLCAYIIVLLGRDVCKNVHNHLIQKTLGILKNTGYVTKDCCSFYYRFIIRVIYIFRIMEIVILIQVLFCTAQTKTHVKVT